MLFLSIERTGTSKLHEMLTKWVGNIESRLQRVTPAGIALEQIEHSQTETGDSQRLFSPILPSSRQQDFAKRFRDLKEVRHRYALGRDTNTVLTEDMERTLSAVRSAQGKSCDDRRNFLKNVSGYLREALDDDTVELNDVFDDTGLSDRVKGIGARLEKVLPWVTLSKEPWLPPELMGICIGQRKFEIPRGQVNHLLRQVKQAMSVGETSVALEGVDIPANSETVEALEELARRSSPPVSDEENAPQLYSDEQQESSKTEQYLLVIDNLEDINYWGKKRQRPFGIKAIEPKLASTLLPHQVRGLQWLKDHWKTGSRGALLAGDMGLGKTLEVLAFLLCLQVHGRGDPGVLSKPMLIVAPTGLLQIWKDEHAKHLPVPGLGRLLEAYGATLRSIRRYSTVRRSEVELGQPILDESKIKNADWVLTTYETLRDYQHSFGRIHWAAGVFDEAQKIKNPAARVTEAALAMNIDFSVMVTGTPVENRQADVWSIVDRAEPGRLGSLKEFSQTYESSANRDRPLQALHKKLVDPPDATAPALMLRRLKEDHRESLPTKTIHSCG